MFLTHPELWLAPDVHDATTYLRECVAPRALAPVREYFEREVPTLWNLPTHPGPPGSHGGVRLEFCDRVQVEARIEAIEEQFAAFDAVPWGRAQILADRPGKWDYSLLALDEESIAGFSFNSVRDGWLYVHVLVRRRRVPGRGPRRTDRHRPRRASGACGPARNSPPRGLRQPCPSLLPSSRLRRRRRRAPGPPARDGDAHSCSRKLTRFSSARCRHPPTELPSLARFLREVGPRGHLRPPRRGATGTTQQHDTGRRSPQR